MLGDMGIEPERLRLEWISAAEGDKVKAVVNDMVEKLKALGPLDLPGHFRKWDGELAEGAHAGAATMPPLPVKEAADV
jgi:F420-non-reducing hydrogenase iron-sulfur subunit